MNRSPLGETARRTMLLSEIVSIAVDSFRASKVRFVLTALGMVIRSDQFPDRLFAPTKRTSLLPDGVKRCESREPSRDEGSHALERT